MTELAVGIEDTYAVSEMFLGGGFESQPPQHRNCLTAISNRPIR